MGPCCVLRCVQRWNYHLSDPRLARWTFDLWRDCDCQRMVSLGAKVNVRDGARPTNPSCRYPALTTGTVARGWKTTAPYMDLQPTAIPGLKFGYYPAFRHFRSVKIPCSGWARFVQQSVQTQPRSGCATCAPPACFAAFRRSLACWLYPPRGPE